MANPGRGGRSNVSRALRVNASEIRKVHRHDEYRCIYQAPSLPKHVGLEILPKLNERPFHICICLCGKPACLTQPSYTQFKQKSSRCNGIRVILENIEVLNAIQCEISCSAQHLEMLPRTLLLFFHYFLEKHTY